MIDHILNTGESTKQIIDDVELSLNYSIQRDNRYKNNLPVDLSEFDKIKLEVIEFENQIEARKYIAMRNSLKEWNNDK